MKVAGYARVSTDLQREKETIKTQVELIEKFCEDHGHQLTELFCDDGVSGTTHLHDRPAGAKLMADARAGKFQGLVVYKADRIGRDVLVNETVVRALYDELGIPFLGISEKIDLSTPIGRAMFTFQSAIGRLERENTLQRSRDATLRLARDGVWLGGIVPYGYRVEGKDREARLRLADEPIPGFEMSEVDVVRAIYRWCAEEGLSGIKIAKKLNALGVPTVYARDGREVLRNKRRQKTCGMWTQGRVRNMLIETTYKGVHVWGKRGSKRRNKGESAVTIERTVPAIVDEKTWARAQVTLRNNALARPDIIKRQYLLRGLMKCAQCGRTYIGTVSEGKRVGRTSPQELATSEVRGDLVLRPYYLCNGKNSSQLGGGGTKCQSGHLRALDAETALWAQILGFLHDPESVMVELGAKLVERVGDADVVEMQLQRIEAEITKRDGERALLLRLFRKGNLSESDLERQLAETVEEEKLLAGEAERLHDAVEQAGNAREVLETVRTLLDQLAESLTVGRAGSGAVEASDAQSSDAEAGGAVENIDVEVSWESKRRIIETLVERITVSSQLDPSDTRGRRRFYTLTVRYNFEDPRPRAGSTNGLVLEKELLVGGDLQTQQRDDRASLVQALLEETLALKLEELGTVLQNKHGLRLSRASLSRLRNQVGLAPDNVYSRAAKARKAG